MGTFAEMRLSDYLPNPAHPDNGGKAAFFVALGFARPDVEQWLSRSTTGSQLDVAAADCHADSGDLNQAGCSPCSAIVGGGGLLALMRVLRRN